MSAFHAFCGHQLDSNITEENIFIVAENGSMCMHISMVI